MVLGAKNGVTSFFATLVILIWIKAVSVTAASHQSVWIYRAFSVTTVSVTVALTNQCGFTGLYKVFQLNTQK